jgi:hypothetical protein
MAKNTNGNGSGFNEQILEALHTLHADNVEIRSELKGINRRLDKVEVAVVTLGNRFDHFLVTAGERLSRVEARLDRLEESSRN